MLGSFTFGLVSGQLTLGNKSSKSYKMSAKGLIMLVLVGLWCTGSPHPMLRRLADDSARTIQHLADARAAGWMPDLFKAHGIVSINWMSGVHCTSCAGQLYAEIKSFPAA